MKTCRRCDQPKDRDDFYDHPQMADGKLNICKECVKQQAADRRRDDDRVRENERRRYREGKKTAALERYKDTHRERNLISKRASQIVCRAVRKGILVKPTACEECGQEGYVEGAHADYSKPLQVRWLCRRCHRRWDCAQPKTA